MYLDSFLLLSDAQALSASAYSTNTIDLGNVTPKRNIGDGEPLALCIGVDVAADFAQADETYEFQFVQSVNANLSSHDSLIARVITAANLSLGSFHYVPIPPGAVTKQFVGLRAILGGTTPSVTVTAWVAPLRMIQRFQSYAKGYTIS